ncbi:hydroxymethyldihydropterin pyrophosphokinase-dihydropteroate synthase, putative (PPPK-DHPS), partial [Plasmodium ovale curtisi]
MHDNVGLEIICAGGVLGPFMGEQNPPVSVCEGRCARCPMIIPKGDEKIKITRSTVFSDRATVTPAIHLWDKMQKEFMKTKCTSSDVPTIIPSGGREVNMRKKREMEKAKWKMRNGKSEMEKAKWKKRNGKSEMEKAKWKKRNGKSEMEKAKRQKRKGKSEKAKAKRKKRKGKRQKEKAKCKKSVGTSPSDLPSMHECTASDIVKKKDCN